MLRGQKQNSIEGKGEQVGERKIHHHELEGNNVNTKGGVKTEIHTKRTMAGVLGKD